MKTIIVSKSQLIEVIAESTNDFGNSFIAIAVDNDGFAYSAEQIDSDDHIIMTLSGLENYMDENQVYPGNEGYDSEAVAKYIVENEEFLKTDFEYDDEENVEVKIVGANDITIENVEIIDNCVEDEEGNIQPSEVSALVKFSVLGESFELDFQTTTTHDYGAYSSKLAAYDGSDDYDRLVEMASEEVAKYILNDVLELSDAQNKRDEYVAETYNVSDEYYGGIDGNSEVNKAVRK